MQALVTVAGSRDLMLAAPAMILAAGPAASFAWEEFFIGKLRNLHTRRAYLHGVRSLLNWVELQQVDLTRISPGMIGRFFDSLTLSVPTKKLYLAGIRSFFDVLVQRHVIVLNPAYSVRTERYSATEGRTQSRSCHVHCRDVAHDRRRSDCGGFRRRARAAL